MSRRTLPKEKRTSDQLEQNLQTKNKYTIQPVFELLKNSRRKIPVENPRTIFPPGVLLSYLLSSRQDTQMVTVSKYIQAYALVLFVVL